MEKVIKKGKEEVCALCGQGGSHICLPQVINLLMADESFIKAIIEAVKSRKMRIRFYRWIIGLLFKRWKNRQNKATVSEDG